MPVYSPHSQNFVVWGFRLWWMNFDSFHLITWKTDKLLQSLPKNHKRAQKKVFDLTLCLRWTGQQGSRLLAGHIHSQAWKPCTLIPTKQFRWCQGDAKHVTITILKRIEFPQYGGGQFVVCSISVIHFFCPWPHKIHIVHVFVILTKILCL